MAPDTVLFDLDSTLCRSTQDEERIHAEAFARADIEPFCDVATVREVAPTIKDAEDDRDFFRQVFERVAERVGAEPIDADALAAATLSVKDDAAVEWRPGAKAALARAREQATVGLVTNGSRESQRTKLDVLGIDDAFETIVYAGDEAEAKPSPAPFETALAEIGERPAHALYVGNDYRTDVIGAKRAGLAACWIPSEQDLDAPDAPPYRPDYVFDSPESLRTLL